MTEILPGSGDPRRGRVIPDRIGFYLTIREEANCSRCGQSVVHWRQVGRSEVARCNGPDRPSCGVAAHARKEAVDAAVKADRLAAKKAQAELNAQAERARKAAKVGKGPVRQQGKSIGEPPRVGCPRPDKQGWWTSEACDEVIKMMRAQRRPRALNLNSYLCHCGAWHVGDRTKMPGDAVGARWGSAEAREAS